MENCIHVNQTDGSGWAYKINECEAWPVPPSWEIRMLQDNDFAGLIHDRYFALRKTILSKTAIENTIDSVATLLNEAQYRHFQKWNILGTNTGTPEYGYQPTTYSGVIISFKNWIDTRLAWLDANMIGPALSAENDQAEQIKCRVFPNPVSDILYIESDQEINNIVFFNITGIQVIEKSNLCDFSVGTDLSGLNPGIYIARILLSNGKVVVTRVLKR
jgi:CotH protein.